MAKKPAPSPETARKIWLAGIGAYGRAFSEAQESIARLTGESAKVFDELVAKGEEIERQVEKQGRKVAAQVAPGGLALDERIKRMRKRIGLGEGVSASGDDVEAMEARIKALEAQVAALTAKSPKTAKAPKATKKSARKRKA